MTSAREWFYEATPAPRVQLAHISIDSTDRGEPDEPATLPIILGLGETDGIPLEQHIGAREARRIAAALVAAAEAAEREATTACQRCGEPITGNVPECLPCHLANVGERRARMRAGVISE